MSIRMIAVDMDGTFLNSDSTYDKKRFYKVYQRLQERGIRFVVASGNPYKQLQTTFHEMKDDLTYIAENGGYIVDQGKELYLSYLTKEDVINIIETLKTMPDVLSWACTKNQSYTLDSLSDHYYEMFLPYFPGVKKITDYSLIKDEIIKFALYLPEGNVEKRMMDFTNVVSKGVHVIDSGHLCVDLIPSHTNKGVAIEFLMKRLSLNKNEVMAFGDAGNDEEMLKQVAYGYAMENAKDDFKMKFNYIAPSHNDNGVLEVIEAYLDQGQFLNLKSKKWE